MGNINFNKVGITGTIKGNYSTFSFCGEHMGGTLNFKNCYARTVINTNAGWDSAGFAEQTNHNSWINVMNCYWFGRITNTSGGRLGTFRGGGTLDNNENQYTGAITVTNSYYNKSTFTLSVPTASSGIGLTNEQIGNSSNYVGWDFKTDENDTEYTWYIDPETGYPELHFENN